MAVKSETKSSGSTSKFAPEESSTNANSPPPARRLRANVTHEKCVARSVGGSQAGKERSAGLRALLETRVCKVHSRRVATVGGVLPVPCAKRPDFISKQSRLRPRSRCVAV
eukprot:75221-Pleurochrysis_carterae.AAC.2